MPDYRSPFSPLLPDSDHPVHWGRLYGLAGPLALIETALRHPGLVTVITPSPSATQQLMQGLRFFAADNLDISLFPDWETLPYDIFSPHQDIISGRLRTLARLGEMDRGLLVVSLGAALQRIAPPGFLQGRLISYETGARFNPDTMRTQLVDAGYRLVSQVSEHGEFAVRGSIFDLFPMGQPRPYRLDLFDEEIESIRIFDPETQRTLQTVEQIELMPGREFPVDEEAISRFRTRYRAAFEGDPQTSLIYREVSQGNMPGGIEYYLPLFFDTTASLFDYLPGNGLVVMLDADETDIPTYLEDVKQRYEQRRVDPERPILPPEAIYLREAEWYESLGRYRRIRTQGAEIPGQLRGYQANYATDRPPSLVVQHRAKEPALLLRQFTEGFPGRILIAAESAGRRETLLPLLQDWGFRPQQFEDWHAFLEAQSPLGITVGHVENGLHCTDPAIAVIAESQLMGERVVQERRRSSRSKDFDAVVRNLTELQEGAPVVHEEHGVGRYIGLQSLAVDNVDTEFLTLEYAGGDRVYVPVAALHLVSRYTGTDPEHAPLHRLGSDQWAKAKRKAAEKVRDVAAELLDIYARRAAKRGYAFETRGDDLQAFSAQFPFEETPDQTQAIEQIVEDMGAPQPMDRVVCGDVGFGKTEVAMRAAFIAANDGKQVVVLVPTTLLAQQHFANFRDRFADWPFRIESLSRFRSTKEKDAVLQGLAEGKVDIVIGTHKLLQGDVRFKNLGLIIVDEEHRFGVRQKEHLKRYKADVDFLTLTATPIPRTLNMALGGIRDLSIIATPPAKRLAVKTFVSEWNDALIAEACTRELKRGGQIYFLHNEVSSIEKTADKLRELIPEVRVDVAHGQMRESQLEQVMGDFYHHRFNILVCTTIVESGIDIPTANTIIINRADRFGLAQLHQLRGRVGRSHHRAYAYLLIPPRRSLTADAAKRLEAIESLEDLGVGFMLASNDLEIRGAGELLGDEQSGQIQEIGYSLYTEMLERAVAALKQGKEINLDEPFDKGPEVDLRIPALIPDDYLPDVQQRLILYKRISSAETPEELRELQVEMIDRFGLLPESTKNLFELTRLKFLALGCGIRKIEAGPTGGRLVFGKEPRVDPAAIIKLIQYEPQTYKLDGSEKLRFQIDLPQPEVRIGAICELIEKIRLPHAA